MMQPISAPSIHNKYQAVVRDAATGGVKLCRKCNQPALPGNYGFCAMHRAPRSRGSGKGHDGQAFARSMGLSPLGFPPSMHILQRALQAQAMNGPTLSGTASANGSPFAVSSMASMGAFAPPLLPFLPPHSGDATPVASATASANIAGMMVMPSSRNGQDMPIVYGATVGDFLPQGLPGTAATPVVEAEAEVVAAPIDNSDLKEHKSLEIPQAAVQRCQ